jgi:rSAM/selenodomain-associated transferase 1
MEQRPAVVLFARAPVAGRTKTRLIPALGPERAAELYRCFLLDIVDGLRHVPADVIVAAAEQDDAAPLSAALGGADRLVVEFMVQSGSDLGERILNAVRHTLSQGRPATVVIGTDAPDLPAEVVAKALDLIASHDLVLGPCSDGGYYLIGLRAAMPSLFRSIRWGSDSVLSETVKRGRQLGLAMALLQPWDDVDTPDDLQSLRARLTRQVTAGGSIPCRRTWDYLCDLSEDESA